MAVTALWDPSGLRCDAPGVLRYDQAPWARKSGAFARASFSPVDLRNRNVTPCQAFSLPLIERGRTGKGVYLEASLLDSSIGLMSYLMQNYWRYGSPAPPARHRPSLACSVSGLRGV